MNLPPSLLLFLPCFNFDMLGTGLYFSNSPGSQSLQAEGCDCVLSGMGLTRVSGGGCILGPLLRWLVYPCRNYSAVCVYSLGDIDKVFRTSSLKGYHMGLPNPRPGMVSCQPTMTQTTAFPGLASQFPTDLLLFSFPVPPQKATHTNGNLPGCG